MIMGSCWVPAAVPPRLWLRSGAENRLENSCCSSGYGQSKIDDGIEVVLPPDVDVMVWVRMSGSRVCNTSYRNYVSIKPQVYRTRMR